MNYTNTSPLLPVALFAIAVLACSGTNRVSQNSNTVPVPSQTASQETKPTYSVEVVSREGVQLLNLTSTGQLPAPEGVDRVLKEELEKLTKKNPSSDSLAYAYQGDNELSENQYSGALVYKASKKKIMTMDEYQGVKTSSASREVYFIQTEEQHTFPGITPKRSWLSITLVYPKAPPREEGYQAMIAEVDKVRSKGLDVDAYIKTGDKNVKSSWQQVRDSDGAFVFAQYEASTKQVTRKGTLLRQF